MTLEEPLDLLTLTNMSISMGMLLLLKRHLQTLYGLSELRCNSFVPNEGSKLNEKPCVRQSFVPEIISWDYLGLNNHQFYREKNEESMRHQCFQVRGKSII